jgi:hypothetical protein
MFRYVIAVGCVKIGDPCVVDEFMFVFEYGGI